MFTTPSCSGPHHISGSIARTHAHPQQHLHSHIHSFTIFLLVLPSPVSVSVCTLASCTSRPFGIFPPSAGPAGSRPLIHDEPSLSRRSCMLSIALFCPHVPLRRIPLFYNHPPQHTPVMPVPAAQPDSSTQPPSLPWHASNALRSATSTMSPSERHDPSSVAVHTYVCRGHRQSQLSTRRGRGAVGCRGDFGCHALPAVQRRIMYC
ncbi:hypothetical protein PYCCODRAFT_1203984 [Trametes coccinea BRFM310]|uniref:Uncharacterized protein n=1 Tax=Trametes coccinea (strain BRFM310) TaxID=1353009 RepID=A0A1Y2I9C2_TRAC3|nr:hypothetical protein PYCCODRAFT_1203984 [Trametes coccinea BRFM310]